MADKRDLTGVWYGRYDADAWTETNGFIAVLEESGGVLTGVITERDTTGRAEVRRALVDGRRDGTGVRFVKQYDGSGGHDHAIDYSGNVDAEGLEMTGIWRHAFGSGRFVMEREKFDAAELEAEEEAGLTVH
jgi:hypothetical protein